MKKIIVSIIFLQLIYFSCYVAPNPIFRLQTIDNEHEKFWLNGKEYSNLVGDNYEVIIAYDDVYDGLVSVDVEISNNDSVAIDVSSKLFTAYYLDYNQNKLKKYARQDAIDPEVQILETDKNQSKENARYAQKSGMKALSSLFELTADIAAIGKEKTKTEIEEEIQEDINKELQDINDENYHNTVESNISNEKYMWAFTALRKTTLPPDFNVNGKIYFPFISHCRYLKIVFYEDKENLHIIYKVNKFNSN